MVTVAPGIDVQRLPEAGVNAVIVHDGGEALVVDVGAWSTEQIVQALDALQVRVVAVVITHPHWDHAFGLAAFDGVPSYAHPLAIADLHHSGEAQRSGVLPSLSEPERTRMAGLELRVPTVAVAEPLTVAVGSRDVILDPIGHAHSPGDLVVHVPTAGVSIVGDLVEVGADPAIEDADIDSWLRALERIGSHAEPVLIPGHGHVVGHDRLAHHREFLQAQSSV